MLDRYAGPQLRDGGTPSLELLLCLLLPELDTGS